MSDRKVVRVSEVMAQNFAIVDGIKTIAEAITLYQEQQVQALFVDKRNGDDEYGILLLSDIAKQVLAKDRAPERVNIYEVMTKPVISVQADMDVRYCARLFDNFGLSLAPVVDNGEIRGVVSYNEIVLAGL